MPQRAASASSVSPAAHVPPYGRCAGTLEHYDGEDYCPDCASFTLPPDRVALPLCKKNSPHLHNPFMPTQQDLLR
jgi:hypothetical protein